MSWEIQIAGQWQSFASLGLKDLKLQYVSQDADSATFSSTTDFDSEALLAYRTEASIRYVDADDNATLWFTGERTTLPRNGGPRSESITYRLDGPWAQLERCPYEQEWALWDSGAGALVATSHARVILNQSTTGKYTVAQQIKAIVDYAQSKGVNIQATGASIAVADVALPSDERTDVMCAEAIRVVLRHFTNVVVSIDYSTTPPTLCCKQRASCTAASVTIPGPESVSITRRDDLAPPGILIRYEQLHQHDSNTFRTLVEDSAGDTAAYDCVKLTVELAGTRSKGVEQYVRVESLLALLDTDAQKKTWLLSHFKVLSGLVADDITIDSFSVASAGGEALQSLSYVLVAGEIPPWLQATVNHQAQVVTASLSYERSVTDVGTVGVTEEPLVYRVMAVDADCGVDGERTYQQTITEDAGEPIPSGLAAALYAAWSEIHYDGTIAVHADECSGTIRPGNVINIQGGMAEWQIMRALVQSVTEDVEHGRTSITIGPPRQVTIDDLLALAHASRTKKYAGDYSYRASVEPGPGADPAQMENIATVGGELPGENEGRGLGVMKRITMGYQPKKKKIKIDPADGGIEVEKLNKIIKIDPELMPHDGTIQPREIQVCEDGVVKNIMLLCSETYI